MRRSVLRFLAVAAAAILLVGGISNVTVSTGIVPVIEVAGGDVPSGG
jgi:hypothetical protein